MAEPPTLDGVIDALGPDGKTLRLLCAVTASGGALAQIRLRAAYSCVRAARGLRYHPHVRNPRLDHV